MKTLGVRELSKFFAVGTLLLGASSLHAALIHEYSFTSDASDSVGGANGTWSVPTMAARPSQVAKFN